MKILDVVSLILLIIGGLNLGVLGVFQVDPIAKVFGDLTIATRVVYALVGLAGLYEVVLARAIQHRWGLHWRGEAHA